MENLKNNPQEKEDKDGIDTSSSKRIEAPKGLYWKVGFPKNPDPEDEDEIRKKLARKSFSEDDFDF